MLDSWWRRISISMKKGILKKSASRSQPSGRRAKWNEDNLEANEVIKSELNPTKIDDPKTPYHAPLDPVIGRFYVHVHVNRLHLWFLELCQLAAVRVTTEDGTQCRHGAFRPRRQCYHDAKFRRVWQVRCCLGTRVHAVLCDHLASVCVDTVALGSVMSC